jgi:class 3 adenylate cyclase
MPSQPITVLYAELPGIADLSEKLNADRLQVLLGELQEMANATLRLHGGRISQFLGDSFYAIFPGQKTEALSSVLAIETAIEFKERLEILTEEMDLSQSIGFKSAIVKADAVITELDDSGKITIMGQAMTYAHRLKDFAVKGQVLTDGTIYEESKDRFDFLQLEPLPVRGSKEPLEVYELKGKRRLKLKIDSSSQRRIFSEMVGRTNEMELVEGQVKKLLSGKGAVVNIIGKAGIGKSRLVAELMAQDYMEKAAVLEARALSIGQNLSFHPIVEIIKSWAGISEEDTVTISSEKLYQSIQKTAAEHVEEIFPFIATMMGMALSGEAKKRVESIEGDPLEKLILKNLRDLIIKAASLQPLIIMIEDMHWSDSSTITFLESMFKLVRTNQVMFINILRPGYEKTGDHLLKYLEENLKENHLNIFINALTGKESNTLIDNLLQKVPLPPDINDMIIRKTEGNPFFIEEVIRSFIDEGVVEVQGNRFRVSDKIHEVNIPETINDVILSRVDKLDEKTKELLKTASVIGRNF